MSEGTPLLIVETRKRVADAVKMPLGTWSLAHPLPAILEPKFDGRRVFFWFSNGKGVYATKHNGLYSRLNTPRAFADLPSDFRMRTGILDCEFYPRKEPSFVAVFDILERDGEQLWERPLSARKAVLKDLFTPTEHFAQVPFAYVSSPTDVFLAKSEHIERGFEGVMLKDPNASYGANGAWLKMKKADTVDAVILGPDPENDSYKRTGVAHSWFIGLYDDFGEMEPWGKVGTYLEGVDPSKVVKGAVVEILFQEATAEKKLRDPRIVGIRDDKTPAECLTSQVVG